MAYIAIRIDEGAAEILNQYAAEKGLTKSQAIISALKGAAPNEVSDAVVDMSDWVDGQAPECCIDSIANGFKPGHVCPDWARLSYTDKNGLRRQAWFNNRTGEYEFSDRWKQIRADYRYE